MGKIAIILEGKVINGKFEVDNDGLVTEIGINSLVEEQSTWFDSTSTI